MAKHRVMDTAEKLAWPRGTKKSKYAWKGGKPTKAFKKAMNKVFPNRSKWNPASKAGCACDVCVAVVMRLSGVAKKYPRGRWEQEKYKPKNCKRIVYKNAIPAKVAKPNDVVIYLRGGKKGHTLIRGNGCWYEGAIRKTYLHKFKDKKKLHKKYRKVIILREK